MTSTDHETIYMYCDGACRGNPGPGGWGVLLRCGEHEKKLYGGEAVTTNNRMELMAAIQGLRALKRTDSWVVVTTDSQYLRQGITEWLPRWKQQGWKTSARQPVKNQDLWEMLEAEVRRHRVRWHWVKGHSGHVENEIADQLAKRGISEVSK